MVKILKYVLWCLLLFMIYMIVSTSMESNLFEELPQLASIPWMKATLWDFYANVFLIYCWVIYKEQKVFPLVVWAILFFLLGSIATISYVLTQLYKLKSGEGFSQLLLKTNKSHE